MTLSVALPSLERVAGRKRRKKKRYGEARELVKTRSGGGKKSRNKGNKYERDIAKAFEAYYGCRVSRAPRSGGWSTVAGFGPRGDLIFAHRKAPYHVECKKQEGWDLSDLLTGKRINASNGLRKWWKQASSQCGKGKVPMLVFARNHQPSLLMMRRYELSTVCGDGRLIEAMPRFTFILKRGKPSQYTELIIMLLSDFFTHVRPPTCSPNFKKWRRT